MSNNKRASWMFNPLFRDNETILPTYLVARGLYGFIFHPLFKDLYIGLDFQSALWKKKTVCVSEGKKAGTGGFFIRSSDKLKYCQRIEWQKKS